MPISLQITTAELEASWRRVRHDHRQRRTFVRPPFLLDVIESDLVHWLTEIEQALGQGSYNPGHSRLVHMPKPGGLIRPGSVLGASDEVVYSAIVTKLVPDLFAAVDELRPLADYAYVLSGPDLPNGKWFANWFKYYNAFTDDSLAALDQGARFVVVADIAGYYEEVELQQLRSDLLALGVAPDILRALLSCLSGWGPVEKRGLPQGFSASDILAKAYLHPVDQALRGRGYHHIRWVDDFRIFVDSEEQGRRAIMELAIQLGQRGLVLQSAKTRVLTSADAQEKFEAVKVLLEPIKESLIEKLIESGGLADVSAPLSEIDDVLTDGKGGESVAVLEEAFTRFFLNGNVEFNKTLFRFLLRRLAKAGSDLPLAGFPDFFWERPEETEILLEYMEAVGRATEVEQALVNGLAEDRLVYDYQLYLILEWRLGVDQSPSKDFMRVVRNLNATDRDIAAMASAILGRWGSNADLDDLLAAYPTTDASYRPNLICSLARLEKTKRNGFFGRAAADSHDCARAVAGVKRGELGWT